MLSVDGSHPCKVSSLLLDVEGINGMVPNQAGSRSSGSLEGVFAPGDPVHIGTLQTACSMPMRLCPVLGRGLMAKYRLVRPRLIDKHKQKGPSKVFIARSELARTW